MGHFQCYISIMRLLGKLTAATIVVSLGLLWLRPFQRWPIQKASVSCIKHTQIRDTHCCMLALAPCLQKQFLLRGVPLGPPPVWWEVIRTDGGLLGWGEVWCRRGVNATWKGVMCTPHITVLIICVLHVV